MITMHDFFKLAAVVAAQEVEKRNAFGSPEHRTAHATILALAEQHNVSEWFESMEAYDAANQRVE